ncbi:hypothetical protein KHF85_19410 [Xanthomonas translucens pv. graminis]|uniref:hypothetical protein n=1 Tax=Xanthomonas graminis TaxID=3390026 RepID=UPI002541311C|nr:hypothetical protein [Xanthomonas translucens]WIH04883.1 hypothetical protein KHF85_19410 [Xanthomonas translucens pv. graminis]
MAVAVGKGERYALAGCLLLLALFVALALHSHVFKYRAHVSDGNSSQHGARLHISRQTARALQHAKFVGIELAGCLEWARVARLTDNGQLSQFGASPPLPVVMEVELAAPRGCLANRPGSDAVILANETYLALFAESFIRR